MGGSGGSPDYASRDATRLREEIHRELEQQEQEATVNAALAEFLAGINNRDVEAVRDRLESVVDALGDLAIDVDRLLFGGSVAKHTYVDGLSDTDALVVVRDNAVPPGELVERFAHALRSRLPAGDVQEVSAGALAVTITYRDGTQVQLLPAVERNGHTSIASEDGRSWRRIRPHKFAEKLTSVNSTNGNAVVPTIKLAKSILRQLPASQHLGGYHIEAIAVDAFRAYSGRRDRLSMLNHMLAHAASAVLRPTGDITGQSVHVDTHLGASNSGARSALSAEIRRVQSRLAAARSSNDVHELFDA